MIDFSKPLRHTHSKKPLRYLGQIKTPGGHASHVVVREKPVPHGDILFEVDSDGHAYGQQLVENVPEDRVVFINIYGLVSQPLGPPHQTLVEARDARDASNVRWTSTALLTIRDGEVVSVKTVDKK